MGQCCPVKYTVFQSESHNSLMQWGFKLNSTPATAENWCLKECILKVKHYTCTRFFKHTFKHLLTAGVRIFEKTVSVVFDRNKSSMFLNTVLNTSYIQDFMCEKKKRDCFGLSNLSILLHYSVDLLKKKSDHKYNSEHPLTWIHARQIMMSI
jgi:hypothetical protein